MLEHAALDRSTVDGCMPDSAVLDRGMADRRMLEADGERLPSGLLTGTGQAGQQDGTRRHRADETAGPVCHDPPDQSGGCAVVAAQEGIGDDRTSSAE